MDFLWRSAAGFDSLPSVLDTFYDQKVTGMFRSNLETTPAGNLNFRYLEFPAGWQHKRDDFKRPLRGA